MESSQNSVDIDTISVSRQIKDGVFRLLFDDPEKAAELYYALSGNKCSADEIMIITITTTISGELKNDLAFVVRGKVMVVGEHMSIPYTNMPVRLLMYIGLLYEKWIKMKGESKFIYGSRRYTIPTPSFVVFYNGTVARPEKEILRLSDAFEDARELGFGLLELEVPVYNINKGMNTELFNKSPHLRQYAEFVSRLREFTKQYDDYSHAVRETVNQCIDDNILSEFLKKEGGKVVSILSTYDPEVAARVREEEILEDIAIEMLRDGDSVERVVKITKLPIETVVELQGNIGVAA
jgi:hypothetical protein